LAQNVTLLQLRTAARQRADMENSLFCSDTEINQLINANIRKIHRRIVKSYGNAYAGASTTVTTAAGTETYALPAAFMKLSSYGVWWVVGSEKRRLSRYNPNQSNDQQPSEGWTSWAYRSNRTNVQYDLFNKEIRFLPTPQAVHSVKIYYFPTPTTLAADADVYDGIAGFDEAVTWAVAADMLAKQESDNSFQVAQMNAELQDLLEYADPDQNEPPQVQMVDTWLEDC
jgi:hypothetical protein